MPEISDPIELVRTAEISKCKQYRYVLTRQWSKSRTKDKWCTWIMLNPSTADAKKDDRTIRRVMDFSERLGFHGCRVVNLYALRSTDPSALFSHRSPIGPYNNTHIRVACEAADRVFCAWGQHAKIDRVGEVLGILRDCIAPLWVFGFTKNGQPLHPLYLSSTTPPTLWRPQISRPG